MFILGTSYLIIGVAYIIYEIYYISKSKQLHIITPFRIMYAFIYGILPAIILFRMDNGTSHIVMVLKENEMVSNLSFMLIISIFEYVCLSVSYSGTKPYTKQGDIYNEFSNNTLSLGITVTLLLGIISLFLWTKEFGYISGFMLHAKSIRSGIYEAYNPLAFMKQFTNALPICMFLSFSLLMKEKREGNIKLFSMILIVCSAIFSLIRMLCSDERGAIGSMVVVTIMCYYLEKIHYNEITTFGALKKILIIGVLAFALVLLSDGVMTYIRYKGEYESTIQDINIVESIEGEFGFTFTSQVLAPESFQKSLFNPMIINDLIGAIISWVPSRFIPFSRPMDLWDYNTNIVKSYQFRYGQLPTDFVTASIYLFGIPGIIVLPIIMGFVLKRIETYFNCNEYSYYKMGYYSRFIYYAIWWVSHFSFAYTTLSLFGMFFTHFVIASVNKIIKLRRGNK